MSYEAWGDDDDGLDGYRDQLRDAGWLDEDQAAELLATNKELLEALEQGHGLMENLTGELDELVYEHMDDEDLKLAVQSMQSSCLAALSVGISRSEAAIAKAKAQATPELPQPNPQEEA